MDRNYFLSYGHKIALLLLLAAVGKLNAKSTSVTISKTELSYRTDVNTQQCLAGTSVCQWTEEGNDQTVLHNKSIDQKTINVFSHSDTQYNFSFFNDIYTRAFFLKNLKSIATCNSQVHVYLFHNVHTFLTFEEPRKCYLNSIKLVDGFEFIIKIPDKLVYTLHF